MDRFRTVPDTNVVKSAHYHTSDKSPNREVFDRFEDGQFDVLYSEDTIAEYAEKLIEKQVPQEKIDSFLKLVAFLGIRVEIEGRFTPEIFPIDLDDIAFLLCADSGTASHLISYDPHLLGLREYYRFKICQTLEFLKDLREQRGDKEPVSAY